MAKRKLADFEPSTRVKSLYLYTRKSPYKIDDEVTLPGLFQTAFLRFDALAFVGILLGEVYGLFNLYKVAQFEIYMPIGLFLADVFFAVLAHIPRRVALEARMDYLVAKWNDAIDIKTKNDNVARALHKEKKSKRWTRIWEAAIIGLALFKILLFFGIYGRFDGITLAVILSYVIVALLHVMSTGYFVFGLIHWIYLKSDENKHLSVGSSESIFRPGRERQTTIMGAKDGLVETTVNDKHHLERKESNEYVLRTTGILMDDELHTFINVQRTQEQKKLVARGGFEQQREIRQTDIPKEL